jgi:AraC-like DNA-binding protein
MESGRFQKWHYRIEAREMALIFPDGCRDVIIVQAPGQPDEVFLTDLDLQPRQAELRPETEMTGYRLRPGAAVDRKTLDAIAVCSDMAEEFLGNELAEANELDEIILALTRPLATVEAVSRLAGVAVRTMQRRFREASLPPPDYWRLLGRARMAACLLSSDLPLAEIADNCGFSDQAHMTRDMKRWFGGTPAQLRQDPHVLMLLSQPALGNWTGEQISTR